ncbi:MAG: hypothetical protein K2N91_08260 [Muribaculaceae bacterium]|nr:hypothetical protein [Muribaculaceae bacterium]
MNFKSYSNLGLLAFAAATMLSTTGCKDEEVYDTQVTREYNFYLDGEKWFNKTEDSHEYGKWNVFIYNNDGSVKGNYKTQYRFALESGTYKVLTVYSPTVSDFFEPSTPINDVVIAQDSLMATSFATSDLITYKAGDPLNINIKTRTGLLRLRAIDEKADKSYSKIRANISTPVKGYHCADQQPVVDGEPLNLIREKETSGGGIGYAEDMLLIGSDKPINITLDYLDKEGTVIKSKAFADGIIVAPKDTTTVSFNLNDPSEQVIVNYTIEVGSTSWGNETQYPSIPVVIPDGYTYVTPEDDLNAIYKSLANDPSVSDIKLFLKANAEYKLFDLSGGSSTNLIEKSISILGQTPGYGQKQAQVTGVNLAPSGNFSNIIFENVSIISGSRFFNIRNQAFNVGEIALINCNLDGWSSVFWNQATSADNQQTVGTLRIENCRLTNYTAQSTPFINPANTSKLAPIDNIIFRGNVIHEKTFSTRNVLLSNLNKHPGNVNLVIEGNTFIATKGTEYTYFNLDGSVCNINLTVKDNVLTGAQSGNGTWFKLNKVAPAVCTGNTRSAEYLMKDWGVEAPAATAPAYNDILKQLNL